MYTYIDSRSFEVKFEIIKNLLALECGKLYHYTYLFVFLILNNKYRKRKYFYRLTFYVKFS